MQESMLVQMAGWIARVSCQATAVAGIILFVQWAFRTRLSPGLRYALWFLLLGRLALPFSVPSAWSLFNLALLEGRAAAAAPPKALTPPLGTRTRIALTEDRPGGNGVLLGVAPGLPVRSSKRPEQPQSGLISAEDKRDNEVSERFRPRASVVPAQLRLALAWMWIAGVGVLSLRRACQIGVFAKRLRRSVAVTDPVLLRLLESCAGLMALPRPPALFESDAVNSPALYGLCRPRLLLPIGMARAYSAPELRFVFLHELAHLKRRDMGVHWLVSALEILHWFNPVLWFAFGRMRSDRELACDALALSRAETGEAKAYGETILRIISDLSGPALVPGLVGIAEDMRQMKTRMRMIAQFRRSSSRPFLPGLFFALLALATLTDAQTKPVESSGAVPPVQTKGAGGQKAVAAAPERSTLVQDGRLLIELGKLDEAEAKLREALRRNANDRETLYYLGLIEDARRVAKADPARKGLGVIEPSKPGRGTPDKRGLRRSPGQEAIRRKLHDIVLQEVSYDGVTLADVVRDLVAESRARDPEKVGVNIIMNPTAAASVQPVIDPATVFQWPEGSKAEAGMLKDVIIRLVLKEVRLGEVIDAICKVAESPIRYTVEDYAVVFTAGQEQSTPLFTRTYRVDPDTFLDGVKNLTGSRLPAAGGSPDPSLGQTSGIGDGEDAKQPSVPDQSGSGLRISGITRNANSATIALLRRFFIAAGVDFSSKVITVGATGMPQPSSKALFFNDRTGLLLVRATTEELDAVEKAVQVLNTSPPQVSIVSRLVEQGEPSKVIASPAVTTLSGRQIRTEIPSAGLRLDVLPNVMGDGWSIQLTVDFTLADVSDRQDRVTTGSPTPQRSNEPRAPLRVSTRAIIWDGQTMELGPFPTSDGNSERKVLLLITPTIIDPAGNRVHSGE